MPPEDQHGSSEHSAPQRRETAGEVPPTVDLQASDPPAEDGVHFAQTEAGTTKTPGSTAETTWKSHGESGERETAAGGATRNFGGYELLAELARGGMGVVYKARQRQLNRLVALKMIRAGEFADPEQIARFHSEAEAAAGLDHPGIVPIFEVGQVERRHFYSMALVDGQSFHARVQAEGPMPASECAALMKSVAEAVDFAHSKGIIHRDIKPQNILLDSSGQPRVTDFGLAKHLSGDSVLTATGQVMGTPSYMAPEQALAKTDEIDQRTDVYALGATLSYLLTGRPPFQAATSVETIRQVIADDPIPPRRLNPSVPRDLETICLKCLEKNPARRYDTAAEFSGDLARFLGGEPVRARRAGPLERAWKWARRNPAVAATATVILLALTIGLAIVLSYNARLDETNAQLAAGRDQLRESNAELQSRTEELSKTNAALATANRRSEAARQDAEAAKAETQRKLYALTLTRALDKQRTYLFRSLPLLVSALETLESIEEPSSPEILTHRQRLGATLASCPKLLQVWRHGDAVRHVEFGPQGHIVLTASWDGAASIWDIETGRRGPVLAHPARVTTAALSPDGRLVATGCDDRKARVWDAFTGQLAASAVNLGKGVRHIEFTSSGDSHVLATGGDRYGTMTQSPPTYTPPRRIPIGNGRFMTIPGRHTPGVMRQPRTITLLWRGESGEPVAEMRQVGWPNHATRSPDGRLVAVAGARSTGYGEVQLWEAPSRISIAAGAGLRVASLGNRGPIPLSAVIASPPRPTVRFRLRHAGGVEKAAFSPDSRRVATASGGTAYGEARVWDTATGEELMPPLTHSAKITQVEFSPDGRLILTGSDDGTARVWDARIGRPVARALHHLEKISVAHFSADSQWVLTASLDGGVRIWDAATGQPVTPYLLHASPVTSAALSRDGRLVVTGCENGLVRVWDLAGSSRHELELRQNRSVTHVAPAAGGRLITVTGQRVSTRTSIAGGSSRAWEQITVRNTELWIWDARTGKPVAGPLVHRGDPGSELVSPDGRHIVALAPATSSQPADRVTILRLPEMEPSQWDMPAGERVERVGFLSSQFCYAVTTTAPASPRRAPQGATRTLHVRDVATGRRVASLPAPVGQVLHAWLDAESAQLKIVTSGRKPDRFGRITALNDKGQPLRLEVHVFRWSEGEPAAVETAPLVLANPGEVQRVIFSPDRRWLVTLSGHTARVWNAETGAARSPLLQHALKIDAAAFSADGRLLATGGADRQVRVWDAQTGATVGPPLTHTSPVMHVSLSADGRRVFFSCVNGAVRMWRLPEVTAAASDLAKLAALLSARDIDSTGGLTALSADDVAALWQSLAPANPGLFRSVGPQVLAWRRSMAEEAESSGQPAAAAFHWSRYLQRLIEHSLSRRGATLESEPYWREAVAAYERSIELAPAAARTHMDGILAYRALARIVRAREPDSGHETLSAAASRITDKLALVLIARGEVAGGGAGSGALHEVTLEGGGRYILEVTGGGFQPQVAVSTATGAIVAEGAAAHGRGVRLEVRPADTGAHRVLVTGRDVNARGGYVVAVRQAPPAASIAQTIVPRPPTSEQTADLGQTHQGELTVADAPDRGRPAARRHVYRLNMQRRQTYRIELESPEFDAYLRLEDEAGRQLAVNDDALPGQSRGAAIQFSPRKDVNCRIVVTTFLEGSTGPYSLRVVKAPARK